jgi:hypothetical protein
VITDPYNARVPVAESVNLLVLGRNQRVRLVHEPNAVSDDPHPSSEKEGSSHSLLAPWPSRNV